MHLVFYGHTILDAYGLATGLTIAVLTGAAYGLFRGLWDLVNTVVRGVGGRDQEAALRERVRALEVQIAALQPPR